MHLLVGVILLDREDVHVIGAGAGIGHLDLGVDRLADLPLGRPVDVEGHLDDDRVGVRALATGARRASASVGLPAASAVGRLASRSSACFLRASYSVVDPLVLGLVPRDARVELGDSAGGQVGLALQLPLGRGDLVLELDRRG